MKCEVCGSANISPLYKLDYNILKCKDCSLTFTDPHAKVKVKELYDSTYFEDLHENYFSVCKKNYKIDNPKTIRFNNIIKEIEKIKKPGKILDVGCATGVFLDIAKKRGWKAYGVDISTYATKYARKAFKLQVKTGELHKAKYPSKFFDVVTLWDFIEHCPNPAQVIREVKRILKDDGLIFILTINEDGLLCKLAHLTYAASFGKIKFFVKKLHPVHHLFHFSKKTIKKLLEKNNFSVLSEKGSDIPAENINEGKTMLTLIKTIYAFAKPLNMQYEISLLAKKT